MKAKSRQKLKNSSRVFLSKTDKKKQQTKNFFFLSSREKKKPIINFSRARNKKK